MGSGAPRDRELWRPPPPRPGCPCATRPPPRPLRPASHPSQGPPGLQGDTFCLFSQQLSPHLLQAYRPPSPQSKPALTCEAGAQTWLDTRLAYSSLLPEPGCLHTGLPAPRPTPACFPLAPPLLDFLRDVTTPCGLAFKAPCRKPQFPLTFTLFSGLQSGPPPPSMWQAWGPQHQQEPGAQRRRVTLFGSTPGQESRRDHTPLCPAVLPFTLLLPPSPTAEAPPGRPCAWRNDCPVIPHLLADHPGCHFPAFSWCPPN